MHIALRGGTLAIGSAGGQRPVMAVAVRIPGDEGPERDVDRIAEPRETGR